MAWNIGEVTGLRKRKSWCDGKTQYKSQRAADVAIAALRRRADRERGQAVYEPETLTSYRCTTCGFWHFGHERKRNGEEEKRGEEERGQGCQSI